MGATATATAKRGLQGNVAEVLHGVAARLGRCAPYGNRGHPHALLDGALEVALPANPGTAHTASREGRAYCADFGYGTGVGSKFDNDDG